MKNIKLSMAMLATLTVVGCSSNPSVRTDILHPINQSIDDLYLRGVFNWWEANEAFKFQKIDDDTLTVTVELIADGQPYDFKVSDSKWTTFLNCGQAVVGDTLTLGKSEVLVCQGNSLNLQFIPSATGDFIFTLDISSPGFPEITVTSVS